LELLLGLKKSSSFFKTHFDAMPEKEFPKMDYIHISGIP